MVLRGLLLGAGNHSTALHPQLGPLLRQRLWLLPRVHCGFRHAQPVSQGLLRQLPGAMPGAGLLSDGSIMLLHVVLAVSVRPVQRYSCLALCC